MRANSLSAVLLLGITTLSLIATLLFVRFNAVSLPAPRDCHNSTRFEFCESNAHRHLTQLSKTIGQRPTGSAANYQHTIPYIVGIVRQLQREIEVQRAEHSHNETAVPACRLRLDFEVQTVEGVHLWDNAVALSYANISNVLVRLAPTTTSTPNDPPASTLLVSSHIDSAIASPGAGDDGVAVSTMLETIRVLVHRSCAEPSLLARNVLKFRHPIIFLFNNAEEMGLLGAHGFARSKHRWLQPNKGEIGAFINLEGAGTRGKAMLFQTGPGNAWIADMYAAAVPFPRGTVMAQDVFQTNLIPSDTDFRVYSAFLPRTSANASNSTPIPGIDLALIDNGFCYHTPRDSLDQVSAGTLQHMGDNLVALASHFLRTRVWNDRAQEVTERAIYYDLVGWGMVSYSETTSQMLHVAVVTAMVVQLTRWRLWTPSISLLEIVGGCFALVVSMICGIGGALGIASIVSLLLPNGAAMSWFSHPIIAVLLYGIPAQAFMSMALLLFDAIRRVVSQLYRHHWAAPRAYCRIPPLLTEEPLDEFEEPPEFDATILHRVLASLMFWALLLISGSVYRIGSTYLALWMTTALFIGANVVVFGYNTIPTHVMERPDELRGLLATLLLVLPPIALLLDSLTSMVSVFIAISGRAGVKPPPDLIVGGLAAVGSVLVGSVIAPILSSTLTASTTRRLCLITLVLSLLAAPLTIAIVSHDGTPYSHDHPKRLLLEHVHEYGTNHSHIAIIPADALKPPSTRVIERMKFAPDPCTSLSSSSPTCVSDAVGALPSFVSCPTVPALKPEQIREPSTTDSTVLVATAEPARPTTMLHYYLEQHSQTSWTLEISAPDTLSLEINVYDLEVNAPLMSWDALDSSYNGNFSVSPYTDSLDWHWYSLLPKERPNNTDTSKAPTPLRARHTVGYNPSRKWIQRFIVHPNRLSNLTVRLWAFYEPSAAVSELQATMPDWCVPIGVSVVRERLSFGRSALAP